MFNKAKNIIIGILLSSSFVFAQHKNEFGFSTGGVNYLGDVGGYLDYRSNFIKKSFSTKDFYFKYINWSSPSYQGCVYFKYKINKRLDIKSHVSYLLLTSSDVGNTDPNKVARNLSFKTKTYEFLETVEFNFFMKSKISKNPTISKGGKKRIDIRAYFFTGLGFIKFTPTAQLNGITYKLRKYKTENINYSPLTWVIPFGLGISYEFNKKYALGFNYSYRFTGSDYLDDVSGFYNIGYTESANKDNLRKPEIKLANRTPEVQTYDITGTKFNKDLPEGKKYEKNSVRGNGTNKDGYFIANVSFGIILKGKNKYYRSKSKGLKNRRKKENKRFRAKF